MEDNNYKDINKHSIIFIIIAIVLIIGVGTFAWLTYQSNKTKMTLTVGDIDSAHVTLSPYQIKTSISPQLNYTGSTSTNVDVVNNSTSGQIVTLFYKINKIDSELISNDFRYTIERSTDGGTTYTEYQTGNFSSATNGGTLTILEETINGSANYKYKVYVWLYGNSGGQNNVQGKSFDGELNATIESAEAIFDIGTNVNVKMKNLAGDDTSENAENTVDTNITAIKYSSTMPNISGMTDTNLVSTQTSKVPIYMWYDSGTIYWWSSDNTPSLNSDASRMFRYMTSLADISGLQNMDTSNVTTLNVLFTVTPSLLNLHGLENWDTSNVTNIRGMFSGDANYNCNLTDISALINWNVSNVTDMSVMLQQCNNLTSLHGLENWDTSNVETMQSMFYGNMSLVDISALYNWDVSSTTNMQGLFYNCSNLSSLHGLENWNVSSATNMSYMFVNSSFSDANVLRDWNVSSVTDMQRMFAQANLITLEGLENWNVSSVTNMNRMFNDTNSLTDASAINDWNIINVTNFTQIFRNSNGVHPTFSKRTGTWSNGTFTPSS